MELKSDIQYAELIPDNLLMPYVKSFWHFQNASSENYDSTILPDGCFDLIVEWRSGRIQNIFLTGIWTNQIDIHVPGNTSLFGIRFKLLSGPYLLQQDITSIRNSRIVLDKNFWQINTIGMLDFTIFSQHITRQMSALAESNKSPDPRKVRLFDTLYATQGAWTVMEYAKMASWSSRQINRYFNHWFGLSLKTYCNILKVNASYREVKQGELYPQQHYFDQSHFIKEIKKHTGVAPKDLSENKNDRFLQLLTLKEK